MTCLIWADDFQRVAGDTMFCMGRMSQCPCHILQPEGYVSLAIHSFIATWIHETDLVDLKTISFVEGSEAKRDERCYGN